MNGNEAMGKAIAELLIKHIKNKANNTVTDDPELAALKDSLLNNILNKSNKKSIL